MKKSIVIVEDDTCLAKSIQESLEGQSYKIRTIENGKKAYLMLKNHMIVPDLVILDITLPKLSGLDVCHLLRRKNFSAPIIMITNDQNTNTLIDAFDLGADDYLKKPFDLFELEARIKCLLLNNRRKDHEIITLDDIKINVNERKAYKSEKYIFLRRKEFDLLLFLARNANKVISRDTLITNIWPFDQDPYPNTVDVHVSYLRKRLEDNNQTLIETVHGVGYRLNG